MLIVTATGWAAKTSRASRQAVRPAAVPPDTPSGFFPGLIHYFAGDGPTLSGTYADGSIPTQVPLSPTSMASDSKGNIYINVVSGSNSVIYMVYAGGTVPAMLANVTTNATPAVTPVAGRIYQVGGQGSGCGSCDGMPLNQVVLGNIDGLVFDAQDDLYYVDQADDVVRVVNATTSNVTTVAGTWATPTSGSQGDGGPATSATLNMPYDIKLDSWGNLYINDNFDDLVRVVYQGTQPPPILAAENVTVGPSQLGYIYSVAGQLVNFCTALGTCGDGGTALSAGLGYETSIAVDSAGDVFIADIEQDASSASYPYVRVVYAGGAVPPLLNLYLNPTGGNSVAPTAGYIYPVTGYSATTPFSQCATAGCGDGGTAGTALFGGSGVTGMSTDSLDNLYVVDQASHAVRKLDASAYSSTVAGIDDPTQTPPNTIPVPDGGSAVGTFLNLPFSTCFDPQNNLYIADNDLAWQVTPLLPQTVTLADIANVMYGSAPVALNGTASSGLPVQYSVSSTPAGIATISGATVLIGGAGTVNITASQPGNGQYTAATPVTKTFTVSQAPLTVTANPASRAFGAADPAFTATITGFVNGDTAQTAGAISGAPAFSTTATSTSPQGTYPITVSLGTLSSANYSFPPANFFPGVLTVTGNSPQTITFPPFSPSTVTYGQAPITMHATASSGGPVTFLCQSGPCQLSGTNGSVLTITGAGTIVIQAIQNGYLQYLAAPAVTQTLIVNPAVLTIKGPSVTVPYGSALDPTTFPAPTITGFVGADTPGSVLTGSVAYSIPPGAPDVGTYPIVVALGTLALLPAATGNYTFAPPVNGTLVIQQALQVINFNPISAGQNYGQQISLTALATSGLPVTFVATGPVNLRFGNTLVPTGVGTVSVTAVQAGNVDYAAAQSVTQTFNIGPAPLNVQALSAIREQGAPNPTLSYQIGCANQVPGCWVGNDTDIPSVITGIPDISTAATVASLPGAYPIVIGQGTLAAPNYSFVFLNGTLTVTPPGSFTITANPSTLTIPSGLSGQSTITITPANAYQGTVTLSCGQLPANVSCVVSPATYTFPGSQNPNGSENAAQGTITINTAPGNIVGAVRGSNDTRLAALALPGFLAGVFLLVARRRAWKRWGLLSGITVLLGASVLAATSCGGSVALKTAAAGTMTISISGSGTTPSGNGSVTASVPLTVVIQ